MPTQIRKRNGKLVPFDAEKIRIAIHKANQSVQGEEITTSGLDKLTHAIIGRLSAGEIPAVEQVQDLVEEELIAADYAKTAKAYILYGDYQQTVPHFLFVESGSNVQLISHAKSQILLSPADAFLQSGNHQIRFQTVLCFCV